MWSSQPLKVSIKETEDWMLQTIKSIEKPWIENYAILLRPTTNPNLSSSAKTMASISISITPATYTNNTNTTSKKPKMIGIIGTPRKIPGGLEIGYKLHPECWGCGCATEAMRAFLNLCWNLERTGKKDVRMIVANIDTENKASERVVEKSGFREGEVLVGELMRPGESVWFWAVRRVMIWRRREKFGGG